MSRNDEQLEQKIKGLIETHRIAHIGTWRLNLETDQVVWSEELYKMYGFDPNLPPPAYQEHQSLFVPESWDLLSRSLEQTVTLGIPYELELMTVTRTGENGWMWVRGGAERDADGKIIALWGAAQDITQRKITEQLLKDSEERYRCLFDHSGVAIVYYTTDGVVISCNRKAMEFAGGKQEHFVGRSIREIFSEEEAERLYNIIEKTRNSEEAQQQENRVLFRSGYKWLSTTSTKVTNEKGDVVGIQIASIDVTEKRMADELLRKQNEVFTSLLKLLPVGVFMVDARDGKPLIANDEAMKLLGRGILPDANEQNLSDVYQAYRKDTTEQYPTNEMPIVLGMKGISAHIEDMIVERPDGTRTLLEVFGSPVTDKHGNPWASLVTFMDITERKKAEDELLYLSNHDNLTGFYNRRFFENELIQLDENGELPLSLIICDINGLKLINDSFGHPSGDLFLMKAADTIRAACGEKAIVSRIGGDEFAVLLPGTATEETMKIVDEIKNHAAKEVIANIELSIAIGHDTKTNANQKIIEVLANAENHMYRHKLYERTGTRSKTIDIIMNTLFEKSNRESMHSNRVSNICMSIASKMNFSIEEVNKIRIAGLVHDIGKIGIDEKILNKPGKLDTEERDQINKHPEVGWRILSSASEFSELANFVLDHHERWDGTGYPNGLQGEDIPLESRIIAVADSYDAMTGDRSYRKGLSQEEAIVEIKRCSGSQFDPAIVLIFLEKVIPSENNS